VASSVTSLRRWASPPESVGRALPEREVAQAAVSTHQPRRPRESWEWKSKKSRRLLEGEVEDLAATGRPFQVDVGQRLGAVAATRGRRRR
jgi:hypothetical protein